MWLKGWLFAAGASQVFDWLMRNNTWAGLWRVFFNLIDLVEKSVTRIPGDELFEILHEFKFCMTSQCVLGFLFLGTWAEQDAHNVVVLGEFSSPLCARQSLEWEQKAEAKQLLMEDD